ncbi:hypothetical protein GUITHDRAFT_118228 [Guillardia theta CCMP2712]|uniref:SET domain-containing protein n=1 Tax=Guillardia theta (strain CCMP2712) TaxID=905079 RepID=L1IHA8_GUITC|nr:hypothetical protein GUITHDRAFT_118228 [Guillardia theta CCMP2712]EKX35628.1 hypothetical protein GUITHDRAFT_118228 [Guillardia theta CCMP2712]|eukprot:XP_005822608.1 hypothetical protein GUITHDRAFT_118228 [Guillardia theta CCMP2712]
MDMLAAAGFRARKVRDRARGKSKREDLEVEEEHNVSSKKLILGIDVPCSVVEYHTEDKLHRPRVFGKNKNVRLPALQLRRSNIPFGGLGVFAKERIEKGAWITEYGGEVIGRENLCIDSRLRGKWNLDYYVGNHMLGGFFNDAYGTPFSLNSTYVEVEGKVGFQPPYAGAPYISKRIFLRATADIEAGEELFVSYGQTYHVLHFNPTHEH